MFHATKAAHAMHARLCCTLSKRQVALHQNTVMLRRLIIALFCSTEPTGKFRRTVVIRASRSQSSIRVRRISSVIVNTRVVSSIVYRPRQSRPCDGGQSDGGGGCIACDRNEEAECFVLAAISRRTVPNGRKKDVSGTVIYGGGECLRLT